MQYIIVSLILLLTISSIHAQAVFRHTAVNSNSKGNATTINHRSCNNNPNAFIIVTQVYGNRNVYNPHQIGVFYNRSTKKWMIWNQNLRKMPLQAQFNVLVIDKTKLIRSKAGTLTHTANSSNTSGHITTINHPFTNNDPNARLLITPNWGTAGPFHKHPIGVWYSGGKWKIYNEDIKPMPRNAKFNVLVLKSNASESVLGNTLKSNIISHKTTANTIRGARKHISITSHTPASGFVFATHNYKPAGYLKSPFAMFYTANKWAIINQDQSAMTVNTSFNLLAVSPKNSTPIIMNTTVPFSVYTPVFVDLASGQTNTNQNFEAKGPNLDKEPLPVFINLQAELSDRFDPNRSNQYSRIQANLIQDKEPRSGVFYYLPNSYHLEWDKDLNKHKLNIDYGKNTDASQNNSTRVQATLTSGITLREIRFIEEMLKKIVRDIDSEIRNPKVKLKPLPVENPRIEFRGGGFDISNDQISTIGFSDFGQPLEIAFTTSDDNIDALKSGVLQNGLSFMLHFQSKLNEENEAANTYDIPAKVSIRDEQSYGVFIVDLESLTELTNPVPFPILVKYLHVLTPSKTTEGIKPTIYSFDLGDKTVQPKDILKFTKPTGFKIPSNLKPLRAFIDYSLLECETCSQDIINDITGGLSAATKQKITFRSLNLLKSTGAAFIWVDLKSAQMDPGKRKAIETSDPIEITSDNERQSSPTLYLYDSEKPDFEYKVTLVMPDGLQYEMDRWIKGSKLQIILSPRDLKKYFDQWPSSNEASDKGETEN